MQGLCLGAVLGWGCSVSGIQGVLVGEHRVVGCLHPMCIFNTWVLARLVWLLVIDITSLIVNILAMFDWLEQFE